MGWNPFEAIGDALSSAGTWIGNGFSSFGEDLWNFGSGVMDYVDPSGALHTTKRQKLADATNEFNLYSAQQSLNHQLEYDKWARQMAERSQALTERQYNDQLELARHPISNLLADASKVGVSPMAALGQSVGSVSVNSSPGGGNSSVGNNQAANRFENPAAIPALMQTLSSSVLGKRQQDLTEDMFNKELGFKYDALHSQERMAAARNKVQYTAQSIIQDFNNHKKDIDLKNYELVKSLNEQQISKLQSEILNLRGSYEKSMQEIEYMKNKSANEKQALKNEREHTWVSAISGIIQSVISGASNLAGKGAFLPF